MKVHYRFLGIVFSLYALILAACQPGIAPVDAVTCLSKFEATVHHGPSAGLAVTGKLLFTLDHSGELIGGVVTDNGDDIPITGQANGRAINMSFKVGEQKFLFGVGSAENPIYDCTGFWGGGFTGPEVGDSGDWLASDGNDIMVNTIDIELDPTLISELSLVEDPATGNITVSTAGGELGGTNNFMCSGQNGFCSCSGTADCTRLAETGLCQSRIDLKNNVGVCTFKRKQHAPVVE